MNATTIANHVPNVTSSTVQDDPGGNNSIEAYSVVLFVTTHLISILFGGIRSLAIIFAILTKGNINKHSYLLVLTLLFVCCCINFVFSPMEISDLLIFHFHQRHPSNTFIPAKAAVFTFLAALIGIVILLFTVEAIFRKANCFGRILQRIWPFTASLFALVSSAILTAILISNMVNHSYTATHSYDITDSHSRVTFLALIVFVCSILFIVLTAMLIQFLKSCIYWEDGHPHFRKKKMSLALPEFLISQSHNDCEEDTGGYDNVNEPSTSRTPSPSTPKLLMVSSPETASIKGVDATPTTQATPKSSGNRLGINMAQVLGRRRHTICQISDSTGTAPLPPDAITKAKQYNYVRKFSVDISALQAQLQNPKIFKEAPFQSDIDLAKKGEDAKNRAQKPLQPLQPLQPLNLKLDDNKTPAKESTETKVETPKSAGLSIPPPVIMVSNEDVISEKEDNLNDEEKENADKPVDNNAIIVDEIKNNCNHQNNRPEIPTTLSLKENNQIDDMTSVPTLESAVTDPSDTELEGNKLACLSAGLVITFLVAILPVLVTEAIPLSNISFCTLAIFVLQTIVYPHLIVRSDEVVRRAMQRLKDRLKRMFCRGEYGDSAHNVDDTSSTSHV